MSDLFGTLCIEGLRMEEIFGLLTMKNSEKNNKRIIVYLASE